MFARLRVVLAGGLLGAFALVAFVGPEANAVSTDWAQASVRVEAVDVPNPIFPYFDCQQSFRMTVEGDGSTAIYAAGGGRCLGGADLTPGFCNIGEVDCTNASWAIKGAGCEGGLSGWPTLVPVVSPNDADNTIHKAFSLGAVGPNSAPTGCDPEEACLTLTGTGFATGTSITGCGPLALDPPEVEGGGCEFGTMQYASTAPLLTLEDVGGGAFDHKYFRRTEVNTASSAETGSWVTYVVWDKLLEPVAGIPTVTTPAVSLTVPVVWYRPVNDVAGVGNTSVPLAHLGLQVNAHLGSETWFIHEGLEQNPDLTGYTVQSASVVGVGRFYVEEWWNDDPLLLWALPRDNTATHDGVVGVNDPARCAFYFGAKLWNNDDVETDEPGGGLDEELPDDTPDDPEDLPPPDDPEDTDCSGFSGWVQCSILGWLKNIWNAIVSLPSKIANAILDGLQGLFVPEDGFLDDLFGGIEEEWRESAPGAFLTGFSEMGVDFPASGCGGIPVEFATQGVNVDFSLGEACSGAAASAAATVKLVTGASLVLFGGLACVRAIGSGFGWSPGVGKGGES